MKRRKTRDECIEGGVVHNCYDVDAPRKIKSTQLIEFHCVFSLLALADPCFLGNRVYQMDAVLENGVVKGYLDWYCGGEGEQMIFEADPSFMDQLYAIVVEYDFVQYNGYVHTVSGFPNMYGAKLDIRYDRGEYIYTTIIKIVFCQWQ